MASFYYSFTHYSLLKSPHWIGLDNYRNLFSDQFFIQYDSLDHFLQSAVGNTLYLMVIGVPASTRLRLRRGHAAEHQRAGASRSGERSASCRR